MSPVDVPRSNVTIRKTVFCGRRALREMQEDFRREGTETLTQLLISLFGS
jgi:hypothetical protein